ncbi:baculoviral IAP repeat-containing protein 3-like [Physella acuta]|uniref:baculoviral IAP repeat-containing protein 3-like n=1 Tax=Physella acuta TaxID=109671 RepID=UPI0027DD52CE|nr:baculoviral IAP repeat-containing protein 3-like [Physella acuta]
MYRLATFRKAQYPLNWRLSFIELQVAGFSYERSVSRVVCEFCNSSRALAAFHSDPTSPEYHNNGCRFISGPDARHDETAVGAAASNDGPELRSLTAERGQRVAEIRVTSNVHPLYKTYKKRKQSFSEVSRQLKDIHLLASYGFFYGGAGNKIYCFCCGLYLRHRTTAEQVFQQHQHQKPQCRFFQSRRNNEWPPEEENDAGTFLGRWSTFSNAEGSNLFSSHLLPSVLARSGYSYTARSNGQTHWITHSCGYKRTLNNIEQDPNCPYCDEVQYQEEYGEESDFVAVPASQQSLRLVAQSQDAITYSHTSNPLAATRITDSQRDDPDLLDAHSSVSVLESYSAPDRESSDTARRDDLLPASTVSRPNMANSGPQAPEPALAVGEVLHNGVTQTLPGKKPAREPKRNSSRANQTKCAVCNKAPITIMFEPCRHLCVCSICSPNVSECPACQKPIERKAERN